MSVRTYRFKVRNTPLAMGGGPGIFHMKVLSQSRSYWKMAIVSVGDRDVTPETGYPLAIGVDYRFELAADDELWGVAEGEAEMCVIEYKTTP